MSRQGVGAPSPLERSGELPPENAFKRSRPATRADNDKLVGLELEGDVPSTIKKQMLSAKRKEVDRNAAGESDAARKPSDTTEEDEAGSKAEDDAQAFLHLVRKRIEKRSPKLYISFLGMMTEFHQGSILLDELAEFVVNAFGKTNPDIPLAFNVFLPDDQKVTPALLAKRAQSNDLPSVLTSQLLLTFVRSKFRRDPNITAVFRLLISKYRCSQNLPRLQRDLHTLFASEPSFLTQIKQILHTPATGNSNPRLPT